MAFAARTHLDWQLRSRVLPLGQRTLLMAIVNLTPDSFSGDGFAARGPQAALEAACAAADGGADIVDLGGESTRPGATPLSAAEEEGRLLPVLAALRRERPDAILSVDTYHAATARAAAVAGAEIINDVSGLRWDQAMAATVAETGCGLVLMHTRGRPNEWRSLPRQSHEEVVNNVLLGLAEGMAKAESAGVSRECIVLDPGFGFGKKGPENFALLANLPQLQRFGRGVLVGLSRKGFLGETVRPVQPAGTPKEGETPASVLRRNGTLAGNVAAILGGAHLLRVHDLQAAKEAAAIADAVLAAAV